MLKMLPEGLCYPLQVMYHSASAPVASLHIIKKENTAT